MKKKDNDITIYKPNALIEICGAPITYQGLLTYNYLLHKFQKEKKQEILISATEIFKALNIADKYEELFSYFKSLLNIQIISKDKYGKEWGGFNLLSEFKKIDEGFYVAIPKTIFLALTGTENKNITEQKIYYTTIELLKERTYSCSYTIIFYEILKKYEKVNIPIFQVEELKELTNTTKKYKEYKDFKRYVLVKALKEVNSFDNNYQYSIIEKKLGRKVNEIQFIRTEKNKKKNIKDEIIDAEIVEENTMSERLLKAIKKAKKSMYISKVYSDKAMKKLLVKYDESLIIRALEESAKYNQEINSFSSFITAKVEDIKNSSNEVIERKLEELNKVVASTPIDKKEITEDNIADIFNKKDDKVEELKIKLFNKAKEEKKLNSSNESFIKACKTEEDIKIIADYLKIEL